MDAHVATLGTDSCAAKRKTKACQESARAKAAEVTHMDELHGVLREDVCSAQKVLERVMHEGDALRQQLESADAAAVARNWYAPSSFQLIPFTPNTPCLSCTTADHRHVEDARTIQGRVFFKDLVRDAEEVQHKMESTQQLKQKWQRLLELKDKSSQLLATEMDEQLREMTALTAKLRRAQSEIDAASRNLEECRIDRVKAEQDHCDRFRLSATEYVSTTEKVEKGANPRQDNQLHI